MQLATYKQHCSKAKEFVPGYAFVLQDTYQVT